MTKDFTIIDIHYEGEKLVWTDKLKLIPVFLVPTIPFNF